MGKWSQITWWCHEVIRSQVKKNGVYIDATMGKGKDTLFLCEMARERGKVLAFDIQEEACRQTETLLKKTGMSDRMGDRLKLILDGHENMDRYAEKESADAICFNFGYLPGGDHRISTMARTSLCAVEKGLDILKPGGLMSLCIYSGGDTGFQEKEAVLSYIKQLPAKEYTVIVNEYYNRVNHPPIPVFIFKEKQKGN